MVIRIVAALSIISILNLANAEEAHTELAGITQAFVDFKIWYWKQFMID